MRDAYTHDGSAKADLAARGNDDQLNVQILSAFINNYSELIRNDPQRAFATLRDVLAEHDGLALGSREILSRQEWRAILDEQKDSAQKEIHIQQLRNWILNTYSTTTAMPWIETLRQRSSNIKLAGSDIEPRQDSLLPTRKTYQWEKRSWALFIVLSALTALLITKGRQHNKTARDIDLNKQANEIQSHEAPEEDSALRSLSSRSNYSWPEHNRTLPNESTLAEGRILSSPDVISRDHQPREARRTEYNDNTRAVASPKSEMRLDNITQQLENGQLSARDLELTNAQALLEHWIQSFNIRRSSLNIVIRTREEVSKELCRSILNTYRIAYKNKTGRHPAVTLESSRHAGKDSSSGFLPVCRVSPEGRLILG